MPGAGTDKTKRWVETLGPVVILVEPQMGENIGAVARAMANFGLSRLRLVKPRQAWPNDKAYIMAAGADRILDGLDQFIAVAGLGRDQLQQQQAQVALFEHPPAPRSFASHPVMSVVPAPAEAVPAEMGAVFVPLMKSMHICSF